MSVLVKTDLLYKSFGSIKAVNGISLNVEKGEVLGFLGPNGAGKSTTMKMITGFLEPESGDVSICGIDMISSPKEAKKHIGYLPEGAPLYSDMTPRSFLGFIAEIHGFRHQKKKAVIEDAVEKTGLHPVLDQSLETLSKGYKRRVGLAQAILHDPEVLILDEPTDGLDPNQKHHVRELIREISRDKAIIVSTHILEEVEAVCTRAVVINNGTIVADGTAEELQKMAPYHNAVAIKVRTDMSDIIKSALSGIPSIERIETIGEPNGTTHLRVIPKEDSLIASEVATAVKNNSLPVEEIFVERGKLDDVFRQITSSDYGVGHA